MIEVKILNYRPARRYAVRQRVMAAKRDLLDGVPSIEMSFRELKDWSHIEQYTQILAAPSPVVNGQLVCEGSFPTWQEVMDWLRSALTIDFS